MRKPLRFPSEITSTLDIGDAIRFQRKQLGLTQATLAAHVGLSNDFVNHVENGKPTAEIGKVLVLLNAIGIDMALKVR